MHWLGGLVGLALVGRVGVALVGWVGVDSKGLICCHACVNPLFIELLCDVRGRGAELRPSGT